MSDPKKYTVGWICAIEPEFVAAQAFLDEEHDPLELEDSEDSNGYALGKIGPHNVVIAGLPDGEYGTDSAAVVAKDLLRTFPNVRVGLMVGIGGGAPSSQHDIRLGDVVVSQPGGGKGGVFQYDFGKVIQDQTFLETRFLNQPPDWIRTKVGLLKSMYARFGHKLGEKINEVLHKWPRLRETYSKPTSIDKLFKSTFTHQGGHRSNCESCGEDLGNLVVRSLRSEHENNPAIHYGLIASGNKLMKDAMIRDKLANEESVLCFEMEAAGLMNHFPCLVIRGICDYSDTHKNKEWQGFAAMMAAAYATDLLCHIPLSRVESQKTIIDQLFSVAKEIKSVGTTIQTVESKVNSMDEQDMLKWLCKITISERHAEARDVRQAGSGEWLLHSQWYEDWIGHSQRALWLYGPSGCGKTVLCSRVIDHIEQVCQKNSNSKFAYWYFQFNEENATQDLHDMLRSFIRQLIPSPSPPAMLKFLETHRKRGSYPSLEELMDLVVKLINMFETTFLIVDALDECNIREQLCIHLQELSNRGNQKLRVLVTSRGMHDIRSALQGFHSLNIEHLMNKDVDKFVGRQLQSKRLSWCSDHLRIEIENELLASEQRRFLWAKLQIKRLKDCHNESQIRDALTTIPKDLESTYERTLNNIPDKDKTLARQILMWLCYSLRPMTLNEIAAAVQLPRPGFVLRICTSTLVRLIHGDILVLSHFSVKEYLVLRHVKSDLQFTRVSAQLSLATATVQCLLNTNSDPFFQEPWKEEKLFNKPAPCTRPYVALLPYCARFWPQHVWMVREEQEYTSHTESALMHNALIKLIIDLFSEHYSTSFRNWLKIYDPDDPWDLATTGRRCPRPLYYASLLGLPECTAQLLRDGATIRNEGSLGNAFIAAACKGHLNVMAQINKTGYQIEPTDVPRLIQHLENNFREVIKFITEKSPIIVGKSVIEAAANNWKCGRRALEVILCLDTNIHIHKDAISATAKRFDKEMMVLLLKKEGNIQICERVVKAASQNWRGGRGVILALLQQHQISIGKNAAAAIAENFDKKVVETLLWKLGENKKLNKDHITTDFLAAIAKTFDAQTIRCAIPVSDHIYVTSEVVEAAAENRCNKLEIMIALLSNKSIFLSETAVSMVAKRFSKRTMMLLLDREVKQAPITQETVASIARKFDNEVMTRLFDSRVEVIVVDEGVIAAAVKNRKHRKMLLKTLFGRGMSINFSQKMLEFIIKKPEREILGLALRRQETRIQFTEDAVTSMIQSFDNDVISRMLDRREEGIRYNKEAVESIAMKCDSQLLIQLFDQAPECVHITEDMVVLFIRWFDKKVIKCLFDLKGTDIEITDRTTRAASRNREKEEVTQILYNKGMNVNISLEVVKILGNSFEDKLMLALHRKDCRIRLSQDALTALIQTFTTKNISVLLGRQEDNIYYSENVIKLITRTRNMGRDIVRQLFNRESKYIHITEDIVKIVARRFDGEVMRMLLNIKHADIEITTKILRAANHNINYKIEMLRTLNIFCMAKKAQKGCRITRDLVEAATRYDQDYTELMNIFIKKGLCARITSDAFMAIKERSSEETMTLIKLNLGKMFLWNSVKDGDDKLVKLLLDNNVAKPSIMDANTRQTALWWASKIDSEKIVRLLLECGGVDANIADSKLRTPLWWASKNGNEEIVKLLLEYGGVDANIADSELRTPLQWAFKNDNKTKMNLLKEKNELT